MTTQEIKQLAIDINEGKVFTSMHVPDEDLGLLISIFMPLGLGALSQKSEEDCEKIGFFYEYLDKAAPRSINGYPSFFSFNICMRPFADQVVEEMQNYKRLKEAFTAG